MELLLNSKPPKLVYHLENPFRQPWSDLCAVLETNLSIPMRQRLPFQKWLDKVAARGDTVPDLLEFFRDHFLHLSTGGLVLDTQESLAISPTPRSSGSVRFDTIGSYLSFWKGMGFLR